VDLAVTKQGEQGVPVVAVRGEVDVYAAPALRDGLIDLLQDGGSVIVDLTDVGFLDSTGLGALVAARAAAQSRGATLTLVCTHERILKLFTITGLDGVFPIHETVDAALASRDGA
jgi:anti-sigma B factor antagonist